MNRVLRQVADLQWFVLDVGTLRDLITDRRPVEISAEGHELESVERYVTLKVWREEGGSA